MMAEKWTLRPPVEVMLARAVDSLPTASTRCPVGCSTSRSGTATASSASARPGRTCSHGAAPTSPTPSPRSPPPWPRLPDVVVDGELVIWGDGGLDFPALLQRMASKGANARQLAAQRPANFVVFDLLAADGDDLRREPLRVRRRRLEQVLADVDPSLMLSPATTDREQAQEWLTTYAAAHVGIEGIVAKGLGQPLPGRRPGLAQVPLPRHRRRHRRRRHRHPHPPRAAHPRSLPRRRAAHRRWHLRPLGRPAAAARTAARPSGRAITRGRRSSAAATSATGATRTSTSCASNPTSSSRSPPTPPSSTDGGDTSPRSSDPAPTCGPRTRPGRDDHTHCEDQVVPQLRRHLAALKRTDHAPQSSPRPGGQHQSMPPRARIRLGSMLHHSRCTAADRQEDPLRRSDLRP